MGGKFYVYIQFRADKHAILWSSWDGVFIKFVSHQTLHEAELSVAECVGSTTLLPQLTRSACPRPSEPACSPNRKVRSFWKFLKKQTRKVYQVVEDDNSL